MSRIQPYLIRNLQNIVGMPLDGFDKSGLQNKDHIQLILIFEIALIWYLRTSFYSIAVATPIGFAFSPSLSVATLWSIVRFAAIVWLPMSWVGLQKILSRSSFSGYEPAFQMRQGNAIFEMPATQMPHRALAEVWVKLIVRLFLLNLAQYPLFDILSQLAGEMIASYASVLLTMMIYMAVINSVFNAPLRNHRVCFRKRQSA